MKKVFLLLLPLLTLLATSAGAQQTWTGRALASVTVGSPSTMPSTDDSKVVYLYNVGTRTFVDAGGHWGTQAIMEAGGGIKMWIGSSSQHSGKYNLYTAANGYLEFMNGGNSVHDENNLYLDRTTRHNVLTHNTGAFTFTAVSGQQNVYQLTVKSASTDQNNSNKVTVLGIYYLTAMDDGTVAGTEDISTLTDVTRTYWKLVTLQDKKDAFNQTQATNATPAVANFLLKDRRFGRHNGELSAWQRGDWNDISDDQHSTFLSFREVDVKPSELRGTSADAAYTFTRYTYEGTCTAAQGSHTVTRIVYRDMGDTWEVPCGGSPTNADAHTVYHESTNVTLTKKSTETVNSIYYYVGCGYNGTDGWVATANTSEYPDGWCLKANAATDEQTTKERNSHWVFGGDYACSIFGQEGIIRQQVTVPRKGWWRVSCKGFSTDGTGELYAIVGDDIDNMTDPSWRKFKIVEAPKTFSLAAKKLNGGQEEGLLQSVLVYCNANEVINFGARSYGGDEKSWTCVDDFTLEYLGDPTPDILLDEDNTDLDLINGQVDANSNHTLRLHRTFKDLGHWATILLPFSLTAQQVTTTFGGNAKLSRLDRAEGKVIYFEKVDLTSDPTAIALQKDHMYIIKPQRGCPTGLTPLRRGRQNAQEAESDSYGKIMVDGVEKFDPVELTDYYTFNQVTFDTPLASDDVEEQPIENTAGEHMWFDGTYINLPKTAATGSETASEVHNGYKLQIPRWAYVLQGGKWIHAENGGYTCKGFRGWLKTDVQDPVQEAKEMMFCIDGVMEESSVTAIDGMEMEPRPVRTALDGIYSLGGQKLRAGTSTEGLPAGIYVVGGRKTVVR